VKPLAIALCILCQLFLVTGQLFLKRAMHGHSLTWRSTAMRLIPGIAFMSAWFFLWLGLLETWELSHIFPFEGLNPALLVLGAWFFFKEKLTPGAWMGIVLITLGIILVA
jgi:uncharacterized membrane protein